MITGIAIFGFVLLSIKLRFKLKEYILKCFYKEVNSNKSNESNDEKI